MELISGYMNEETLRHKLNVLTKKTFGFDFEKWVTGGYFEGDYIPYSLLDGGEMVSNVSANIMTFLQNGEERHYIQIGTVMTDAARRKQGLARRLMETVIEAYKDQADGLYLFGDLGALDFYRKLGFRELRQYQYTLKPRAGITKAGTPFQKVQGPEAKQRYMGYVRNCAANSAFEQVNKFGLQMFYTANMENVYYAEDLDCFIVLEAEEDEIALQSVIARQRIPMKDILSRIDVPYRSLKLGFTPCAEDAGLFDAAIFDGGDDYRLFCMGKDLESIEAEKLYFPALSHA